MDLITILYYFIDGQELTTGFVLKVLVLFVVASSIFVYFISDLRGKLTGREAEAALGRANITVNKNAVPNDPQKPMITSGIRLGSPAMTTRGFKEHEAEVLANLIADVLDAPGDDRVIKRVTGEVKKLCDKFPVYGQ